MEEWEVQIQAWDLSRLVGTFCSIIFLTLFCLIYCKKMYNTNGKYWLLSNIHLTKLSWQMSIFLEIQLKIMYVNEQRTEKGLKVAGT